VTRSRIGPGVEAVGALTLVYDHHVRELSERLTDMQHELGEKIRSSLHVHLNHDYCLEVVVVKGPSDELTRAAQRFLAMRGVKHVAIELVTDPSYSEVERPPSPRIKAHPHGGRTHTHAPKRRSK
jgi:nickel-responsive transcriptional regulator NikR